MKTLIIAILLFSVLANAKDDVSNDFSRSDSEIKPISVDDLSWRFHIAGDVFIVSSDGEKLINVANEKREWKFGGPSDRPMVLNWRFEQKGLPLLALRQKWILESDGRVKVEIQQYESMERGTGAEVKYGKLIREEKLTLKNFAPIDWPISTGSQKVVVRLTPGLWQNDDAIDVSSLPISGRNMVIYDRSGRVWGDQVTPDHPSVFFGVTTHEGSMFLSFVPFKGAKLVGDAKGNRIKVKNGKGGVYLQSETPFLPKDVKANVYGILKPEMRTDRLTSVRTYSSDKEEEFLKAFADR